MFPIIPLIPSKINRKCMHCFTLSDSITKCRNWHYYFKKYILHKSKIGKKEADMIEGTVSLSYYKA